MRSVLVGLMILAPFIVHAETLSLSGTVVDDAVAVDVFGADVEIGNAVTIEFSIDLSTPPDGIVFSPGGIPGATGDLVQYDLAGRGAMDVEIGSATFVCDLGYVFVLNDYVYLPAFPAPTDGWFLSAGGGLSCGDALQFSVFLQGNDSNVLTNPNFFLPTSLTDFAATFTVNQLVIDPSNNTVQTIEAANGTIDAINVLSPAQLIEDLAEVVQAINIQAGISDALDRKLIAALSALEDTNENNDGAALNTMYAFCNNVDAQRGRSLTDAQADTLIDAANEVVSALDEYAPLCE